MEIYLYVNNSPKNKIDKVLSNEISYAGTLRNETSVINPVIMLESYNISNYNYAFIPDFGRFYFISDIISIRNGLWEVHLKVDVLESFKTEIKSLEVILKNSQTTGATNYIMGDVWKTNVKETTNILTFPNGLSESGEFILITAGG